MPLECRIRINAVKAYNYVNNVCIGSHHVSWRVFGTAQREIIGEMALMYMGHTVNQYT